MVSDKHAAKDSQDADESLAEILGLLARECSWSHDYIADNFTVQQIRAYYEIINKQKMREQQLVAICTVYATATAFGSMKFADFRKFLDKFEMKKEQVEDTIKEMKNAGLPIEEK